MAGKECWSVGKGRGKVLPNLGVGVGEGSVMRRRRPTQGSPPTQEYSSYLPERGRIPCFAGCPDRPPHIQPTNIPGAPRRCHAPSRAQGGQGAGKDRLLPILPILARTQPQRPKEAQVQD